MYVIAQEDKWGEGTGGVWGQSVAELEQRSRADEMAHESSACHISVGTAALPPRTHAEAEQLRWTIQYAGNRTRSPQCTLAGSASLVNSGFYKRSYLED